MGLREFFGDKKAELLGVAIDAGQILNDGRKRDYDQAAGHAVDMTFDALEAIVPYASDAEKLINQGLASYQEGELPKGVAPIDFRGAVKLGAKSAAEGVVDWAMDAKKPVPSNTVPPNEQPAPKVVVVPEIVIHGDVPAKPPSMDPRSVIVDGVVKAPNVPVQLQGTPTHIHHNDKSGLTTVWFEDQRHQKRAVSFADPMGYDKNGAPIEHPLHDMVEKMQNFNELGDMKLAIDGKGNTDFAVGNSKELDTGHTGPGDPKNLRPGDKRLSHTFEELSEGLQTPANADAARTKGLGTVTYLQNGVEKTGGLNISGKITSVSEKDGIATVAYDVGGRKQEISFREPAGFNRDGEPIHNPLQALAEAKPGERFQMTSSADGQSLGGRVGIEGATARESIAQGPAGLQLLGKLEPAREMAGRGV